MSCFRLLNRLKWRATFKQLSKAINHVSHLFRLLLLRKYCRGEIKSLIEVWKIHNFLKFSRRWNNKSFLISRAEMKEKKTYFPPSSVSRAGADSAIAVNTFAGSTMRYCALSASLFNNLLASPSESRQIEMRIQMQSENVSSFSLIIRSATLLFFSDYFLSCFARISHRTSKY